MSAAPFAEELVALALEVTGATRAVLCVPGPDGRHFTAAPAGETPVTEPEQALLRRALESNARCEEAGGVALPLQLAEPGEPLGALGLWGGTEGPCWPQLAQRFATELDLRRTLRETRRQLERADRLAMVGRLAAGIAHELGTPLAVVAGRARQLASKAVPEEETTAVARGIAEQADRMAGIIRQLLDFARRRGPKPGRFDVRTLLRQAVTLMGPVAERKQVALVLADLPVARVVQFDGSQMMQVVMNLLANALQATPAGGQVLVSLEEATLTPPEHTGLPTRLYVGLRVKDTGSGIAPERLEQVFEPFFTTKDTGEGTGLGLSVSLGIVRDHEGWIAVESQIDQGSSFIVYLPGLKGRRASSSSMTTRRCARWWPST